jgi:hypothetical protein
MSYDYWIVSLSDQQSTLEDVKSNEDLQSIGSSDEVKHTISNIIPDIVWDKQVGEGGVIFVWGQSSEFCPEISLSFENGRDQIKIVHVMASSRVDSSEVVKKITAALKVCFVDMQTMKVWRSI